MLLPNLHGSSKIEHSDDTLIDRRMRGKCSNHVQGRLANFCRRSQESVLTFLEGDCVDTSRANIHIICLGLRSINPQELAETKCNPHR